MRVNGATALSIAEDSDGSDFSTANADVAGIPWRARAIDDVAVDDDDVEGLGDWRRLRP